MEDLIRPANTGRQQAHREDHDKLGLPKTSFFVEFYTEGALCQ